MFGDTQAVVAAAMQDWYPGKTSSWSETKIAITIEATGLPEIGDHREVYLYSEYSYRDDTKKAVDRIIEMIENRYRDEETEKKEQSTADKAKKIREAFGKI